jgi:hypothetical protein
MPLVWITVAVSAAAVAPVADAAGGGLAVCRRRSRSWRQWLADRRSLAGVPLLKLALSFGWRRWWLRA